MQLAISAAGAVAGFYLSGGNPYGAMLGWSIGAGIAGATIKGATTYGPRLSDTHVQGSSYGVPFGISYGSIRRAGNISWSQPEFTKHETTTSGNKGGGPQTVNTSYTVSFTVEVGESNGDHQLGKVWINGALKGDYRVEATYAGALPLVFYDGNENQLPDPTEEAIEGVGLVTPNRGAAKFTNTDFDVTQYGLIPQFNVELIEATAPVEVNIRVVREVDDEEYPWPSFAEDSGGGEFPHHPAITKYGGSTPTIRVRVRNTLLTQVYSTIDLRYIGEEPVAEDGTDDFPGDLWIGDGPVYKCTPVGTYVYDDDSTTFLWTLTEANHGHITGVAENCALSTTQYVPSAGGVSGSNFDHAAGLPTGEYISDTVLSNDGRILLVLTRVLDTDPISKWYKIINGVVASQGTTRAFTDTNGLTCGYSHTGTKGTSGADIPGSLENNGRWLWVFRGYTQRAELLYIYDDGLLDYWPNHTQTTLLVYATGGFNSCSILALEREGYAVVVYGTTVALLSRLSPTGTAKLLSEIVTDVCLRCGYTEDEIDVTDIEIPVRGYYINNTPITGVAALQTILPIYFVDATPDMRFVRRGAASIVTIPDADLSAHDADGNTLPDLLQITIGDDTQLPQQMIIKFMQADADYLIGSQQSPKRMYGRRTSIVTIEAPVVLLNSEAAQIVNAWADNADLEKDSYTWYTTRGGTAVDADGNPSPHITREPTDVVTVRGIDLRIVTKNEGARGIIKWEGKRSKSGIWAQAGVAGEPVGFVPQEIPVPQETELVILDIPILGSDPNQGVVHVAMLGALRESWKGAALYRSTDGGTNWTQIASTTTRSTVGTTTTLLGNYGGGSFDEGNVLYVEMWPGSGELSGITRDVALSRTANMFAIGKPGGAWEIGVFRDGVLTAPGVYKITGILRGDNGSEWAMRGHEVGDLFVLLPTSLVLNVGTADFGRTVLYKAVTFGNTLASASAVSFRCNGVSLAPYAPIELAIGFVAAGDLLFRCSPRSRLNPGWRDFYSPTGIDTPLGDEPSSYRWQIWTDGTYQTVVRNIPTTTPECPYTVAQQTADFGAPLTSFPAVSVAKIGALGPGYDTLGRIPLFVPDDIGGYVPPNPDPSTGVLRVMPWVNGSQVFSGSMGPKPAYWSVQITAASLSSSPGHRPNLTAVDYIDPINPREWNFSATRGDFGPGTVTGVSTVTCVFTVGTDTDPTLPHIPLLGTRYLNIRSVDIGNASVGMVCNIGGLP